MDSVSVKICGTVLEEGTSKSASELRFEIQENLDDVEQFLFGKLQSWRGNFSIEIETNEFLLAVVDRIRSYPVLINTLSRPCEFTGSVDLTEVGEIAKNVEKAFLNAGYTLLDSTLVTGTLSVPAGHFYKTHKQSGETKKHKYFEFKNEASLSSDINEQKFIDELHEVYLKVFSELISRCNGRTIVIPLSAGYDSRIVLSYLKHLKYPNIVAFSYGQKNFWEIEFAKEVAACADVRWLQYVTSSKDRSFFFSDFVQSFYWQAFNFEQVPQMNDLYALTHFLDAKMIPADSIVVNGQSGDFVDGGHIPESLLGPSNFSEMIQVIERKHFSLWGEGKFNLSEHLQPPNSFFVGSEGSTELWREFERFEYLHRQAKFVVNGQRVYDFLDLDWELPLWDDEVMNFWQTVPLSLRKGRRLTRALAGKKNLAGLFSLPTTPKKVWGHIPTPVRLIQWVFSKTGNVEFANQMLSNYFGTYSSYYPVTGIVDYLQSANGHKNAVSFHTKYVLDRLHAKNS